MAEADRYVLRAVRQQAWDRDTSVWHLNTLPVGDGWLSDPLSRAHIRIQAGRLSTDEPDIYSYRLEFEAVHDLTEATQVLGYYKRQQKGLDGYHKRFGAYPGFAQWLVLTCEAIGITEIRIESRYGGETNWTPGDGAGRLHALMRQDLQPREEATA